MSTVNLFVLAFILLIAGAFISLLYPKNSRSANWFSFGVTIVGCSFMLYLAGLSVVAGPLEFNFSAWEIIGFPAELVFRIDGLSALFVGLICILSMISSLYSIGYLPYYKEEDSRRYHFPLLLFVAGMLAVVTVADLFYFLLFWEFMTLVSYFLVIYEDHLNENLQAGYIYFLMTHVSSVGLIIAAVFLAGQTGSFTFDSLPGLFSQLAAQEPGLLHLILALFFIGFGTKAGMYPFGIWLPQAHPAAPASVSALLSGIMIKMGIYGFLRIFVWLLPVTEISVVWGFVIAGFGVLSMLVGNLRALGEDDSKRLLAQSSIGQMGYILLGLGTGLAFSLTNPYVTVLALVGALYHVINHACFKSLLFLNTGTLLYRTGTRDLNQMGGLIKLLPMTTGCALVGSFSIAGLPPFNGFVSKWLLYQATIFGGFEIPLFLISGVIAIFISTVSLAAYMKYLGTAFLGALPKRLIQAPAGSPPSMLAAQVLLALCCVILGLVPVFPVHFISQILTESAFAQLLPPGEQVLNTMLWRGTDTVMGSVVLGGYAPLIVLTALLLGVLITYGIYQGSSRSIEPAELWNCGEDISAEEIKYRSVSFYASFKHYIRFLYGATVWPQWHLPDWLARVLDLDRWFYFPTGKGFLAVCRQLGQTHTGVAQVYLLWQTIGAGLVFILLFWMMGG